jgi:hypothetical protein
VSTFGTIASSLVSSASALAAALDVLDRLLGLHELAEKTA